MSIASAAMAQLNIRMDPSLKSAGEAVLDRMDITSTQLVRAIWEKIALGEMAVEQLIHALAQQPTAIEGMGGRDSSTAVSLDAYRCRRDEFWAAARAAAGSPPAPLSDEEAYEYLYDESLRAITRGW